MMDYEKLEVYRLALQFVADAVPLRESLPRGMGIKFFVQGNVYVHEHVHGLKNLANSSTKISEDPDIIML